MDNNKTFEMVCPLHKTTITGHFYAISYNGLPVECPFSYCPACKCHYSSKKYEYLKNNIRSTSGSRIVFLDATKYDKLQIVCKPVINNSTKVAAINKEADLLNLNEIYLVNDKNRICPQCGRKLLSKLNQAVNQRGKAKKIVGFHCHKCNKFFVNINQWNALTENSQYQLEICYDFLENSTVLTNCSAKTTSSPSVSTSNVETLGMALVNNDSNNILSANICIPQNILCYEDFAASLLNVPIEYSVLYSIIFRRFDKTAELLRYVHPDKLDALIGNNCEIDGIAISIAKCVKWNLPYICAYDEKNCTDIASKFSSIIDNNDDEFPIFEYDAKTDFDKNIFDIFFNKYQPMLDVKYYKEQTLASKQIKNNKRCLVADEVGTGKTVSALYAIRDVISEQESKGQLAHILIVCPQNKKLDWQSDIRRQLGRYAHIVEQGDNGFLYNEELKNIFFRSYEHKIFICGPTRGMDSNGNRSSLKGSLERWNKNTPWHLSVIDEGHILFNNYSDIRAERCMIMTATPIVVNSTGIIAFNNYLGLLNKITAKHTQIKIDPIACNNPLENDVFTNWFREDMGLSSAKRKISFVGCQRHELMLSVFGSIAEKARTLAALQYVQDDEYLFRVAREKYEFMDLPETVVNHKLNKLVDILKTSNKSYIIFCEHVEVVENIYEKLRNIFTETVVASKCGTMEKVSLIETPEKGQLINSLTQEIRTKKRVFLIATGRTGGTGLNLGEFDGVIHYELPFTSIELEQRYGRVDRMDKTNVDTEKDMIFMLNDCAEDEDDFEINRMLHYCTRKIDATCKYMPIRNTVLFYPEFIKRNTFKISEALHLLEFNPLLSEDNENKMDTLERKHFSYTSKISQMPAWKSVRGQDDKLSVFQICDALLKNEKRSDVTDEQYALIAKFVSFEVANQEHFDNYSKAVKQFREHKKICEQWLGILGATELKEDSVFVNISIDANINDFDDEDSDNNFESFFDKLREDDFTEPNLDSKDKTSMLRQIEILTNEVHKARLENSQLNNRLSNGVFWYENGRIKRATVAEYRAMGVEK